MDDEGLLSQDDISAAFAEAGMDPPPGPADTVMNGPAESAAASPPVSDARVDSTGRPFDEVAAAMAEAIESEKAAAIAASSSTDGGGVSQLPVGAMPFAIPELQDSSSNVTLSDGIDLLRDVELDVKIELGRSRMLVDDVLRLGEGSVVELDKLAGDPVDVYVNDRLVAHGEVLVLNDNFCVRINDIVRQVDDDEN
jgi:flagellar motor switch protein FliN/FliY